MSVTGKVLYDKLRKLRPELSSSITPEGLNVFCNETVQPFLKWFGDNVSPANVLTNEEIATKNKLQEANEWLEGQELDVALEEATRDNPELLKLVSFDDSDVDNLFAEYQIVKDSCKDDESYIDALRNGLENLKKLEHSLEDDIQEEDMLLKRERIEADKAYKDCSTILREFDDGNREFLKDLETLLHEYADAAVNRGTPILWTQFPLELFVKQIELYNHYIDIDIKQQFGDTSTEEQEPDSDYVSFINDSREKRKDDKIQELMSIKANLTNAKLEEIIAKVQEESCASVLQYTNDIYSDRISRIPRTSELRTKILELITKRDILEENVALLEEHQLTDVVRQSVEQELTKVLKHDTETRLERRKIRWEKLRNLRSLVREHGHAHGDLLCLLMEGQYHRLKHATEFITMARHYLTTEYHLSSTRCESMQQQQTEYSEILSCRNYNSFDKLFTSMMCGSDSPQDLGVAIDKYNELVDRNKEQKRLILNTILNSKLDNLLRLENEVDVHYTNELDEGPTRTLRPISHKIDTYHERACESSKTVQTDLTKIRNKMKEQMRTQVSLQREKDILWQRFLADPETLVKTYEEAKQKTTKAHFKNT